MFTFYYEYYSRSDQHRVGSIKADSLEEAKAKLQDDVCQWVYLQQGR